MEFKRTKNIENMFYIYTFKSFISSNIIFIPLAGFPTASAAMTGSCAGIVGLILYAITILANIVFITNIANFCPKNIIGK